MENIHDWWLYRVQPLSGQVTEPFLQRKSIEEQCSRTAFARLAGFEDGTRPTGFAQIRIKRNIG